MAWTPAPRGLIDLFSASLPATPGLERRRMFGYPVAFVNGLMFAGLFGDTAFARLPPDLRRAVADEEGAAPFEPVPGRPLLAYLTLPDALLKDEALFADLLAAACAFTADLPPKVRRPRKIRNSSSRSYARD